MTRYSDLASKAINYARQYFEQKNRCQQLACHTAAGVQRYLGAPDKAMSFVELDEELNVKWNSLAAPVLTQGADGLWYFGLMLHFELPGQPMYTKVALKFGMQCFFDRSTIKLDEEYTILPGNEESWKPMLVALVDGLDAQYSADQSKAKTPIGFIQSAR